MISGGAAFRIDATEHRRYSLRLAQLGLGSGLGIGGMASARWRPSAPWRQHCVEGSPDLLTWHGIGPASCPTRLAVFISVGVVLGQASALAWEPVPRSSRRDRRRHRPAIATPGLPGWPAA